MCVRLKTDVPVTAAEGREPLPPFRRARAARAVHPPQHVLCALPYGCRCPLGSLKLWLVGFNGDLLKEDKIASSLCLNRSLVWKALNIFGNTVLGGHVRASGLVAVSLQGHRTQVLAQGSWVNTRCDISAASTGLSVSIPVPGKSRADPNWNLGRVWRELGTSTEQSSDPAGPYGWDGV